MEDNIESHDRAGQHHEHTYTVDFTVLFDRVANLATASSCFQSVIEYAEAVAIADYSRSLASSNLDAAVGISGIERKRKIGNVEQNL